MVRARTRTDVLRSLLTKRKIATLDELKEAIGTSATMTVFRKLKDLGYRTSYSHRGRFYALLETPQFDSEGFVFVIAHEDDAKIAKWRRRYDLIDAKSKDPGVMRMRKQLERKRPTRRKTEQYWAEGQMKTLIDAGPAKLLSKSMILYSFLIYLLHKTQSLGAARDFLNKRFNEPDRIEGFQKQLDHMVANLGKFGHLTRDGDSEHVTLNDVNVMRNEGGRFL